MFFNLFFNFILLLLQYGSTESCDKNNDCKGVHTWASGFEKLLEDPKGLQTFAVSSIPLASLLNIMHTILLNAVDFIQGISQERV